jgi:hypothetical protein
VVISNPTQATDVIMTIFPVFIPSQKAVALRKRESPEKHSHFGLGYLAGSQNRLPQGSTFLLWFTYTERGEIALRLPSISGNPNPNLEVIVVVISPVPIPWESAAGKKSDKDFTTETGKQG